MASRWPCIRSCGPPNLIAFKLQGFVNDPTRSRDLDDIRALLRAQRDALRMSEVRDYFVLFDQEALFDALIAEAK